MNHYHEAIQLVGRPAADPIGDANRTSGRALNPPPVGQFTTAYLAVPNRIPVSGTAQVTVFGNGNVAAEVRLHNAAWQSYDVRLIWMVKNASGNGYALAVEGHIAGKLEAGSRNWAWRAEGNNGSLAVRWADIAGGPQRWAASVTLDVAQLMAQTKRELGVTGDVMVLNHPRCQV